MSAYDKIARLYDPWSRSVVEDVSFYVEEAVGSGGPMLELGVGTGRIAVPVGGRWSQRLELVVRSPEGPAVVRSVPCRFVPLVGEEGFEG